MGDGRRVLVLDGDQASALAIVRSLGRRGITVDAGERGAKFLSSHSRYVHDSLIYPDPLAYPAAFVETITERLRHTHYDLVIPVAEDTLQPLAAAREAIEKLAKLAIAPAAGLEIMTDKARTFALAEQLGVPVPASRTFTSEAELSMAAPALTYPVVLKPARSIAAKTRVKLNVLYAHDAEELLARAEGPLALGEVIVQEYFRGAGVGVELLADHGEIVYAFQHKRLHELPLTGGGSCLRESVPVNPVLLEHSKKLMRATEWHGVAMVEFKLDEATNNSRLMEVNPRFWGSLPLAVAAGADFPYYLVELMTRGKRPESISAHEIGTISRKLSSDVYWYVQVLRPDQDEPLIRWPSRQEILHDTLLAFSPRHNFDVQTFSDPKPGLVDAAKTGAWFVDRVVAIAKQKRARSAAEKLRASGAVREELAAANKVLFVCYGNINRSALADHHLRALLGPSSASSIRSAGFHDEINRPADPTMVKVASERGLDLSASRSKRLDDAMVDEADLILAMELKHLERLAAEFPQAKEKARLLSSVTPSKDVPLEIADPYGLEEEAYVRCFEQVTACTQAIVDAGNKRR